MLALNLLCLVLSLIPSAATAYVDNLSGPFKRLLALVLSPLPFALAEVEVVLALPALAVYIAVSAVRALRAENHLKSGLKSLIKLGAALLAVVTAFNLMWGVNYYARSFKERSGIAADGCTVQQLARATEYFAQLVNETAPLVPRGENGLYREDTGEVFERCKTLFRGISDEFPFLRGREVKPKGVMLSEQLSMINTTGITFPFTGECCVNTHAPFCFVPVTAAHETAHQRNVASEDEANFVAVLACLSSDDAGFRYSGSLYGYLLLSNALYSADRERFYDIRGTLCEEALCDLRCNSAYWQSYKSELSETTDRMYDGLLKTYDQEDGIKSYGAAADLLTAYFGGAGRGER